MSQFQSLKNNPKEPIGFSSFNFQCKLRSSGICRVSVGTEKDDQGLVFGIFGVIWWCKMR